jgi:hypothetical protein
MITGEKMSAADRINKLIRLYEARSYLEIGVNNGTTFFSVKAPLKVAVDPNFRFDHSKKETLGEVYLPLTSDTFFADFARHAQASLFADEQGRPVFDIIYIEGLHTFEQSLRDFENSLSYCHENTLWILDDTVPCDPWSAVPDQALSLQWRRGAGMLGGQWHGDVYKTVFAIHDRYPRFSYCTVMDAGNPQTVLWQAGPLPGRKPRFSSPEEIAGLDYFSVLRHADILMPIQENQLCALIGKNLNPEQYFHKPPWKTMQYRKSKSLVELQEEHLRMHSTALAGRRVLFFGCGAAYERYKKLFAAVRPEAVLLDMVPDSGLPEQVDGIPVRFVRDVLPAASREKDPPPPIIIIFARAQWASSIAERIKQEYPVFADRLIICRLFD